MYIKPSFSVCVCVCVPWRWTAEVEEGTTEDDETICVYARVCVQWKRKNIAEYRINIYLVGRNGLQEEWRSRDANAKWHYYYNTYPLPDDRDVYMHLRTVVEYTTWANVWRRWRRNCGRGRRAVMHTHTNFNIYYYVYTNDILCKITRVHALCLSRGHIANI